MNSSKRLFTYIPYKTIKSYKKFLMQFKQQFQKTNPDYDIVIKRLHLYYSMKLVTFDINRDQNLIVQFHVFIEPYTQQPLILYQTETVLVPIVDLNKQADSYTHLQIKRPYITLNFERYISVRQQELQTCKKIRYKFNCKELFVVKHKSKYSCASVIYFNLGPDIIKENCNFAYYFNKTDITPMVFDGGNKIISENWSDDKHIICNSNNNI